MSGLKKYCDIVFSMGQIHFSGVVLYILMIYVLSMNWLQVVLMVIWKIRKHLKPKTNSRNLKLIEIQGFETDNNQLEQI